MDFVGTLTEAEEAVQRYGNILASHLSSLIEFKAQIISNSFNINCTRLERHGQCFNRHFYPGQGLKSQLHLVHCDFVTPDLSTTAPSSTVAQRTFSQVLDGFPYPPVERSGVSWTLEGQPTLPVLHFPMVKCGRRYGVHKVLPQRTVQDHLFYPTHVSHI